MIRGKKRINPNCRGNIETLKSNIRHSKNPFDGTGYMFKKSVSELRKEGIKIIYDKQKCRYYNKETINPIWGYKET